jgi:hypothetical protein
MLPFGNRIWQLIYPKTKRKRITKLNLTFVVNMPQQLTTLNYWNSRKNTDRPLIGKDHLMFTQGILKREVSLYH